MSSVVITADLMLLCMHIWERQRYCKICLCVLRFSSMTLHGEGSGTNALKIFIEIEAISKAANSRQRQDLGNAVLSTR